MSPSTSQQGGDENMLRLIANQIDNLHGDMGDMKTSMKDLASAMVKLALVEERQTNASLQQDRAFSILDKLEQRVTELERCTPITLQTSRWMFTFVWAAAGLSIVLILKKIGLF